MWRWRSATPALARSQPCSNASSASRPAHTSAELRRGSMDDPRLRRSEEHTSELQSLMRISYAVFCLKKNTCMKTQLTVTQITISEYITYSIPKIITHE